MCDKVCCTQVILLLTTLKAPMFVSDVLLFYKVKQIYGYSLPYLATVL